MTREEFINKLQKCYFGEREAFNAIVSFFDKFQALCNSQYITCEKLKKQLDEKDKTIKKAKEKLIDLQIRWGYILDDVIFILERTDK